ncbi:MAG TPA: hypothetical protein VF065_14980, partial [Ilumatobacter sp.]
DVEWNDPRDSFVGIDELEQAIRRLRTSKPGYAFVIASEIDCHHDRLRYRWDMVRNGRILMEGLDVVTLQESSGQESSGQPSSGQSSSGEPSSGRIARVDGFFGHPTPINDGESGVPRELRRELHATQGGRSVRAGGDRVMSSPTPPH